jgi:putative membrane protein
MNLASMIPLADSWGMHGDVGAGWMVLMMFLMVLFWAALIFGIVWLVRGGSDSWRAARKESPTEILDRRLAEGAISAEEYHERREVIAPSSR